MEYIIHLLEDGDAVANPSDKWTQVPKPAAFLGRQNPEEETYYSNIIIPSSYYCYKLHSDVLHIVVGFSRFSLFYHDYIHAKFLKITTKGQ